MDRASAAWWTETPRQRPRPGSLWPARRRARRPVVPRRLQLRPLLGTPTAQGLRSAGTLTLRARQPASKAPRMATSSSGSSAPTSDSTARQLRQHPSSGIAVAVAFIRSLPWLSRSQFSAALLQ
ncbi:hypothetical protein SETIT_6G150400v2 [Setaria italica]|uniref:Uncharacterized protein n=1 Tax=Setaria italica TaxID=4555 RepID=A0A368RND0_SETIT|nr:hypothetical protein SETIT_6G150400v2 [Setaria italica]